MAGLAENTKHKQREREAQAFDAAAEQIASGRVRVYGARADEVCDRLRDKARRSREGERVYEQRSRPRTAPPPPADLDDDSPCDA